MLRQDRDLKIKTGVVKRITREFSGYAKEKLKQEERIEKLVAEGADEYLLRKQHEVLKETVDVLPDCKQRLVVAIKQLEQLLGAATGDAKDEDAEEPAEVQEARKILLEAKQVV